MMLDMGTRSGVMLVLRWERRKYDIEVMSPMFVCVCVCVCVF